MLKKCLSIAVLLVCGVFAEPGQPQAPVALLTYPHSGTQWLTYCVCQLTYRPAYVLNEKMWDWNSSMLQLSPDQKKAAFYHTHRPEFLTHVHEDFRKHQNGKLLIVLRNFKESLFRRVDTAEKALRLVHRASKGEGDFYKLIRNLSYFQTFPPERRLLIYYEDLILSPKETLQSILNFTGDEANIDEFIDELETHKERCFTFYNTTPSLPGTRSFGKPKFHSLQTDQADLKKLDVLFKKHFSELWPYFKRFQS